MLNAILNFDGKHVSDLRKTAATAKKDDIALLIDLSKGEHAIAATWIVKELAEKGQIGQESLGAMLSALGSNIDWEAKLHFLQIVRFSPHRAVDQIDQIRSLLGHPKTLIRVWALDALIRVALEHPKYLNEAQSCVSRGLNAKTASEKARARALASLLNA